MSDADDATPFCPVCGCGIVDDLVYIEHPHRGEVAVHNECLPTDVMLNEIEAERRRTEDMEQRKNEWHDRFAKMRTQRNAAHVILANTVAELGAPEDTAWTFLPEVARELRARVVELEAATDRVREVHQPVEALNVRYPGGRPTQVCSGCGTDDGNWQTYPCPTIRALGGPRPALKLSEVQS
ncbi:hypothetical protein [Nocardia rhizosphaerae]|uniref:Restriction alleviation protein Lar n=1 Tax=Nocardia rhizosphaerae TaxID=1691571 RepID=A0ABV8LE02_9NOCA